MNVLQIKSWVGALAFFWMFVLAVPAVANVQLLQLAPEETQSIQVNNGATQFIVNRQTLITALPGAEFTLRRTAQNTLEIVPAHGGFHLLTGSAETLIVINNQKIHLQTGSLTVSNHKITLAQQDEPLKLVGGDFVLDARGNIASATPESKQRFAHLLPLPPRTPRAAGPLHIAKPDDIRVDATQTGDVFEDNLELEEIEIEAGCVEICID